MPKAGPDWVRPFAVGGLSVSGPGHRPFDGPRCVRPLRPRHRSLDRCSRRKAREWLRAPALVSGPRPEAARRCRRLQSFARVALAERCSTKPSDGSRPTRVEGQAARPSTRAAWRLRKSRVTALLLVLFVVTHAEVRLLLFGIRAAPFNERFGVPVAVFSIRDAVIFGPVVPSLMPRTVDGAAIAVEHRRSCLARWGYLPPRCCNRWRLG